MSNHGSSSRSNVSNHEIPTANIEEALNSQGSLDRDAKSLKLSAASSITKKIRSRILGFSFVKRFIRSKSDIRSSKGTEECSSEIIESVSSLLNHSVLDAVSASTISEQNLLEDESSERIENRSDNHMVEPEWYDAGCNPSIDFTVFESEEPSASNADGEDQTRTELIHGETSSVPQTQPETVSNSMNTSETMTTEGVLMNDLTRSALVTRNIIEFTGALSELLGIQTGRIRDEDPRRSFLLIENRPRRQFYTDDPTNGESGLTRSSTIGSEISSISGNEPPQMQTRNRRVGQDLMPQYYPDVFMDISMDLSMNMVMSKPLFPQDDEPLIY
nr:uncharacterized protein LOC117220534 [Megalopta genalis]